MIGRTASGVHHRAHRTASRAASPREGKCNDGARRAAPIGSGSYCTGSIFDAAITAWVRLSTPSFCRIADTCAFTVASETDSS